MKWRFILLIITNPGRNRPSIAEERKGRIVLEGDGDIAPQVGCAFVDSVQGILEFVDPGIFPWTFFFQIMP